MPVSQRPHVSGTDTAQENLKKNVKNIQNIGDFSVFIMNHVIYYIIGVFHDEEIFLFRYSFTGISMLRFM